MTVAGGFLFGPVIGTIAAIVSALIGGTVVFLVARSACGEWLTRRAGPFAAKLAEGFRADAFSYLVFLRLVPFPFWLINLAAALFGVRLSTFVAATAIGMLPATLTFTVFGAGLDSVIAAQESQYNLCLAAGRADCKIDFNLSRCLTPTLLLALGALCCWRLFQRSRAASSGASSTSAFRRSATSTGVAWPSSSPPISASLAAAPPGCQSRQPQPRSACRWC